MAPEVSSFSTVRALGGSPDSLVQSAAALGWRGTVRGPVCALGATFAAVCRNVPAGPPGSAFIVGCIVTAEDVEAAISHASLLAGYTARAVLVRDPVDVIDLQLQTALLDQGAIVERGGQMDVVSAPGDVVPSDLQVGHRWRTDARWNGLMQAVQAAAVIGEAT